MVTNDASVRMRFVYVGMHADNQRAGVLILNSVGTGSDCSLTVIRHNMHLRAGHNLQTKHFLQTPVNCGKTPYFSQLSRKTVQREPSLYTMKLTVTFGSFTIALKSQNRRPTDRTPYKCSTLIPMEQIQEIRIITLTTSYYVGRGAQSV
jgi:hypothetical protein